MKIVLLAINSKYIHSNLAVYSLRAYAKKLGIETELLEATVNQREEEILRSIYAAKPDVLAVSVYIWNVSLVEELVEDLRLVLPDLRIWLGGPEVSYRAEALLQAHPFVEGVIRGEGEQSFAQVCEYLREAVTKNLSIGSPKERTMNSAQTGKNRRLMSSGQIGKDSQISETLPGRRMFQPPKKTLRDIRGITWREESGIHSTPDPLPLDLDNLPFPYADLPLPEHRIFYYESSRGCPFGCTYCLSSVEKGVRFRDLRLVKRELRFFLDHRAAQVKFVDRTFNCNPKRSLEIWRFLKENDNGVTNFHFETGADLLTEEEIALLAELRPGQVQLECGVQSLNPKTLAAIHRKMDFEKLSAHVRALQKSRNIHMHLDLIAGLPYEDLESFQRSFNGVYALRPDQLQLGFLKILSGSPMSAQASDYGCVFHAKPPYEVVRTDWLSFDDVVRLKKAEEVLEVYYNSGQFRNTLEQLHLRWNKKDAFTVYDALAAFYERRGYFGLAHSRLRRYEILMEFLRDQGEDPADYMESILTDLYLRENLKNRPAWAPPLEAYRDRIRAFYQKEAEEPQILTNYRGYDWKQLRSMTHLEIFGQKAVLFDYRERNPINHAARTVLVSERFYAC